MVVVPLSRPYNIETNMEMAVVNSLEDQLQQSRIRISTASMSGTQADGLPWARALSTHSQVTGQQSGGGGGAQGSTMETPHSFKIGDQVLVSRPSGSGQDWVIYGHPGTIAGAGGQQGGAGFQNGPQQFYYSSVPTQNEQFAKPKVVKTTYPEDGQASWNSPGQVQMQLAQQPDVRQYFNQMATQFNNPQLYNPDVWANGQNINPSPAVGSPITQVIMQQDQTYKREAPKNNMPLQMLHRLRMELNTSSFNNFVPLASNGLMQTFQQLLQGAAGAIQGLSQQQQQGMQGMNENLLADYHTMISTAIQVGGNQNSTMANNTYLNANGVNIYANGQVINNQSNSVFNANNVIA